jgi:hypothetical protein
MRNTRMYLMIVSVSLLIGAPRLTAAGKGGSTPPEPDRIDVIAHFPLSAGIVTQLTTGTHWRKYYLYVDHGPAGPVTVLDVTNPAAPVPAGQLDVPKQEAGGKLSTIVGSAALITSPSEPTERSIDQTVTILSFADPEHPAVARQFLGVTSMLKDTSRGLIYLANSDGLWVLRVKPAADIELQKEYEHYVLYNP